MKREHQDSKFRPTITAITLRLQNTPEKENHKRIQISEECWGPWVTHTTQTQKRNVIWPECPINKSEKWSYNARNPHSLFSLVCPLLSLYSAPLLRIQYTHACIGRNIGRAEGH